MDENLFIFQAFNISEIIPDFLYTDIPNNNFYPIPLAMLLNEPTLYFFIEKYYWKYRISRVTISYRKEDRLISISQNTEKSMNFGNETVKIQWNGISSPNKHIFLYFIKKCVF